MVAHLLGPDGEIPDGMTAFAKFSIGVGIDEKIFTEIDVPHCRAVGESFHDLEEKIIEAIRNCFKEHRKEYGKKDSDPT